MKCVCPMGGDRTCPDDCPLALWSTLTTVDRKAQRKPIAERLYKQNFTMEQIATQLGVSFKTISRDLEGFCHDDKIKPAKTASNPKGAGRPKGKRRRDETQTFDQAVRIQTTPETWKHFQDVAAQEGVTQAVKLGELLAKADGPEIDPATLSLTAQQKLDMAVRQHKAKLDTSFYKTVNDRVRTFLEETILPRHHEEQAMAKKIMNARKGVMDKATFNAIRRALHPDSRQSISDRKLGEAFDAFMGLEKRLLDEKNSPTDFAPLPSTIAEWDALKAKVAAERRARRNSKQQPTVRH